ncbi:OsmC family protein [Microlunatus parietis]|uniref:Putative OsmC-like protein n=1 Tax=Microlunatus parietis TaxID=682979 RepID=A0A7Y9IEY3_9ACTN|nr:OsmC family protein [Microlunatus parietis]NYE75278.1 putative OsmC-like protein [Microlunatus parietis]
MAHDSTHRSVSLTRDADGTFTATNVRGGTVTIGSADSDFTPVELLLAAIAACTAIDVGTVTARRAEPDSFRVEVDAEKIRDEQGNRLTDLAVTFDVTFPDGEAGEAARELLPKIVAQSHDRLCTVGRTIELGTPIATRIE